MVYCIPHMKHLAIAATYSKKFHAISVVLDVVSITYFIWAFFFLETPLLFLEITLGIYFVIEYTLLFLASENRGKYVRHPLSISNALIIIGYLAAPFWNLGFLRILRALRVVQFYQIIPDIRTFTNKIMFWEKLFAAFVHVCVLIFIITEVVYLLQANVNADINSRFDAFYFTTNAITKVGDGDTIALVGVQGQILTLIIAFLSLSIFVQLLDTAREVQQIRITKKKRERTGRRINMDEIYSEQICTYCDIKNREKIIGQTTRAKKKRS